jgi:MFS family permease
MNPDKNLPSAQLVLILTTTTSFMTAFMGSSLNIALPVIGKEFNASALLLSWLSTIYLLSTAALLLPIGRFSDIKGRIKFFKSGVILFSAGSILSALSFNPELLLITRGIQGIGSAFIFSTSTAILVSAYPLSDRGKALGITVAAVYTGLSSGPFLGGLITQYWSWRGIFYINAAIGLIITILLFTNFKKEWEEKISESFDFTGAVIYSLFVIILMIGLSQLPSVPGFILMIAGSLLLYIFYLIETKKASPLFNFQIFIKNRIFTLSNLAALINYSATFAIGFLLSFYLQIIKGLTPQDAGIILISQPVVMAVFSPLSGRLSDKFEPRYVSSAGMTLLTIGLFVFVFINTATSTIIIIANLIFLGFGFALFSSPNANAIMSSVEKTSYGIASSTLASMRMIGQMLSMGIVMVIFNIFLRDAAITAQNQESFLISTKTAFILFSILSAIGIYFSYSRGEIHGEKDK